VLECNILAFVSELVRQIIEPHLLKSNISIKPSSQKISFLKLSNCKFKESSFSVLTLIKFGMYLILSPNIFMSFSKLSSLSEATKKSSYLLINFTHFLIIDI
jgi:hypothetical protein